MEYLFEKKINKYNPQRSTNGWPRINVIWLADSNEKYTIFVLYYFTFVYF